MEAVPFAEEYLVRDAIDNPLILHSLADSHADVFQGDVQFLGSRNHLKLSGGCP